MNYETFKALVAKWAAEKVIPAIAPEGPARWVFAFAGLAKVNALIDQYAALLPTKDGGVDMDALKAAFDSAFAAQPNLSFSLPSVPALAAMGMGETKITFTKADADSLLAYLGGTVTAQEVTT